MEYVDCNKVERAIHALLQFTFVAEWACIWLANAEFRTVFMIRESKLLSAGLQDLLRFQNY